MISIVCQSRLLWQQHQTPRPHWKQLNKAPWPH